MSGIFSRLFGKSDVLTRPVRETRRSILRLEELETRDVPATLYVTSLADVAGGPGELRTQINAAVAGDTVEFSPLLAGGTVDLTGGQLNIPDSITVMSAPGHSAVTIDAEGKSRVFNVTVAYGAFYVEGLIITGGSTGGTGGGINTAGTSDAIFVTDCIITGNTATAQGGGIYTNNTLTMVGGQVTYNTSSNRGGGIFINGGGTIETSTIDHNKAGVNGGGVRTNSSLYLSQSIIAYNTATSNGGAMRIFGNYSVLTAVNDTIYKNTAGGNGGGISIVSYQPQHLTNDTIVSNTSKGGAGGGGIYTNLYAYVTGYTAESYLINCIVAKNVDTTGTAPNINSYIAAYNCDIDNNTGIVYAAASGGNITVDPDLNKLANNGGPTETLMPKVLSPVINAGTNVGAPNVDERGVARPQGGLWDIGAVEVRGFQLIIVSGNNQKTPENELFPLPLVVQVESPDLGVLPGISITFKVNTAANGATGIPQSPTTAVTDSNGEAGLILLADDRTGTFTVFATGFIPFDFPGFQTVTFTETIIDSAHTMEFAEQPNAILAGQAQTVTILCLNSVDQVALDFSGAQNAVQLYLVNAQGQVVQYLGASNPVNGVVTFNDIVLNTVGAGYQFKAICTKLSGIGDVSYIDSIPFDVDPNQPFIGRRT
jgi:hypothetical protein